MIMTQDKARKSAARQRMAETGEPYSVARHATAAHQPDAATANPPGTTTANPPDATAAHRPDTAAAGQIFVRYHLNRKFELEIDGDAWARADNKTRAQLIAKSGGKGSVHPGTTLAELIAQDLDDRGAQAVTPAADRDWEEEYYADGAASEGITVEEFKAREASGQAQEWGWEQAQERTDEARERAQERADQAQERADQAQEQAEEAEERADEARSDADEAREVADDTGDDGDRAAWERAEREADRAQQEADRAQARADHEQERAEREQERADREQERAAAGPAFAYHEPRSGMPRPPRRPRPPRPPRLPRLPRLPGLPG